MTAVNWDRMTAHYNLTHSNMGEIDVDYYLKLDESVAPLILKNMDVVEVQMEAHLDRQNKEVWLRYTDIEDFKTQLEYRAQRYLENLEGTTWASWNAADSKMKSQVARAAN
jgi:hypothetical protein